MPAFGNRILNDVRQFIKNSGLPAYHLRSHEGFWRFLMLRHSTAFDTWMVNIVTKTKNIEVVEKLAGILSEMEAEGDQRQFPNLSKRCL